MFIGTQEADDCFQETFLAALRAYPKLSSDSNVRAWLLTIARNKAIDRLRIKDRQQQVEEIDEILVHEDRCPDREIWSFVSTLPTKQKAAIAYRFAADFSYRQIACELDISEQAARQNVSLGLKQLRMVITDG